MKKKLIIFSIIFGVIPILVSANNFGFLVGGPIAGEYDFVKDVKAGWVRPHTGAFIWGEMQNTRTAEIDFDQTDQYIKKAQKYGLSTLVTLWPYAAWDQSDLKSCKHSDEFSDALGKYRCNPQHWQAYQTWVQAVVERYDGDGKNDMPGLKTPIKYWEVNNEPDLKSSEYNNLQFFIGGPNNYAKLLRQTSQAIRTSDSNAKVVIAAMAGNEDSALAFYRELFAINNITDFFDIANIHCITNGEVDNFNVVPYQTLLTEANINKPIWVTEAETFVSDEADINAAQLHYSVEQALSLGAKKIFFTSTNFSIPPGNGQGGSGGSITEADPNIDGDKPKQAYRTIIQD